MRFSEHFSNLRAERPDRRDITLELCERIRAEPMESERQEGDRTALWGYVPDKERYLKVVLEADDEIVTAHRDRGFARRVRRREREA